MPPTMPDLIKVAVFSIFAFFQSVLPQPSYVEGVVGQPVTFNPLRVGTNQIDRDISSLIFRSLVRYDAAGNFTGDLAERWSVSTDRKEYTFELKREVYWQDGINFTADDVIYSVSQYPQLREIPTDKLDNYTVRFRLKEPLAPFLDILTVGIVPYHREGKLEDLNPVGTGPFRINRVKKAKIIEEVVLQGNNRRLIFRFYENKKDLITAGLLGEVDGYLLENETETSIRANYNYFRIPVKNRYYGLFINLNNDLLKDKDLRKSLAAVTPKQKIADEVFGGNVGVIDGPEDGNAFESRDYKIYTLKDLPEKKFAGSITLSVPKKDDHIKTAGILKEAWEMIGIQVTINPVEMDKLVSEVIAQKKFDILLLGQEVSRDPDRYTLWHSTQKDLPGLNFTGLTQVRIDRSLEEGRKTGDFNERMTSYQHFQEVFAEEVPAIYLYRPVATYVLKNKINPGTDFSGVFYLSDRFNNFNEWALE